MLRTREGTHLDPDKKQRTVEHARMANTNNLNRIPAWDRSAEKWIEYENEVLWFWQSFKPSERPQLVDRLFIELSGH